MHATSESVWRIDKVVGPADVLNEFGVCLERVISNSNDRGNLRCNHY
ncbi:hypothetical protein [Halorientalis marina]